MYDFPTLSDKDFALINLQTKLMQINSLTNNIKTKIKWEDILLNYSTLFQT